MILDLFCLRIKQSTLCSLLVLQYYTILREVGVVRERITGGQFKLAKVLQIEIHDPVLRGLLFSHQWTVTGFKAELEWQLTNSLYAWATEAQNPLNHALIPK